MFFPSHCILEYCWVIILDNFLCSYVAVEKPRRRKRDIDGITLRLEQEHQVHLISRRTWLFFFSAPVGRVEGNTTNAEEWRNFYDLALARGVDSVAYRARQRVKSFA